MDTSSINGVAYEGELRLLNSHFSGLRVLMTLRSSLTLLLVLQVAPGYYQTPKRRLSSTTPLPVL